MKQYFGTLPKSELPAKPDIAEPKQEAEKKVKKTDALAKRPALAFAYHMPARNTPEYYAMGIIDQILVQGSDSKLYEALVQKKGYTGQLSGGINYLGNMFNYNGPMVWMADLIHDQNVSPDSIMAEVDKVIEKLQTEAIDQETYNRAMVKMRSALYSEITSFYGFGTADLLASFALFDDDPSRINTLEDAFKRVTPKLIQETAKEYLRNTNRTVLALEVQPSNNTKK